MTGPGTNLLALALTAIPAQVVRYFAYTGKTTGPSGKDTLAYAAPVTLRGSLQPLSRDRMERMGLEMDKSYVTIFAPGSFKTTARNGAPDRFGYMGRRYEATAVADWLTQDGWSGVVAVDVGPDA